MDMTAAELAIDRDSDATAHVAMTSAFPELTTAELELMVSLNVCDLDGCFN